MIGVLLLLVPIGAWAGAPSYQYEVLAALGSRLPGGWVLREEFAAGALGEAGELAYVAGVGSRGSQALVLDTPDAIRLIIEPGMEAAAGWHFAREPGLLGGIASPVGMNSAGDLAFTADLTRDDRTGAGVFRWESATGLLTALALPGQAGPAGVIWGNAGPRAAINDRGEVAFAVETGATPGGTEGIYLSTPAAVRPIARPGDAVPGGGTIIRASRPSLNNRGQVAFEAEVSRDGDSRTSILLADESGVRPLVSGAKSPESGAPQGCREPRLNDRGQVAFVGDAGGESAYLAEGDRLVRLAGPGTALPFGHRTGSVVSREGSLALNERGQVALLLRLEQPEATGLFLYNGEVLTAVALPGSLLAGVGPVDDLGSFVALNDVGQLAFQAVLSEGEVVLVLATPISNGG